MDCYSQIRKISARGWQAELLGLCGHAINCPDGSADVFQHDRETGLTRRVNVVSGTKLTQGFLSFNLDKTLSGLCSYPLN